MFHSGVNKKDPCLVFHFHVHAQSTPIKCSTKIHPTKKQLIVILSSLFFDPHLDVAGLLDVFVGPLDVFADLLKFQLDVFLLDDHLDNEEITKANMRLIPEYIPVPRELDVIFVHSI